MQNVCVATSHVCTDLSGTRSDVLLIHVNDVWTSRVTFIIEDCACDGTCGWGRGGGDGPCKSLWGTQGAT